MTATTSSHFELQHRLEKQLNDVEKTLVEIRAFAHRSFASSQADEKTVAGSDRQVKVQREALSDTAQGDTEALFTGRNFLAEGPGVGFLAQAGTNAGMNKGVVGIGSSGNVGQIARTIGVLGYTATLDGEVQDGIGVQGVSAGGVGVKGLSRSAIGIGVEGKSDQGGTGVEGTSDRGVGVLGFSGDIGVQGDGGHIAVLGGTSTGLPNQRVFIGVAGQGPIDASGNSFSYGGWFSRGPGVQGGTAPLHLEPATETDPAPPSVAQRGDLFVDYAGQLWFCTDTGEDNPSPATWRQVQLV